MDLLPAAGWVDVATRQDLMHVASEQDLADFRVELHREIRESHRSLWFGMIAAMSGQTVTLLTVLTQIR